MKEAKKERKTEKNRCFQGGKKDEKTEKNNPRGGL